MRFMPRSMTSERESGRERGRERKSLYVRVRVTESICVCVRFFILCRHGVRLAVED